jgi:phospholipase C
VPPTPPASRAEGISTVPITNEIFPGDAVHPAGPYGFGIRVPMVIVSPWSRGGWVNKQLLDHTSLISFLEARFADRRPDLIESNITPWRRAVAGDLTSAFDFKTPNTSRRISLPGTDDLIPEDLTRQPDQVPVPPDAPSVPKQERGVKPARALPYELKSHGTVRESDGSFQIHFHNTGRAAAVFQVRSGNVAHAPRTYTVGAHDQTADTWGIAATGAADYDLSVYGPNGFFRGFKGALAGSGNLDVRERYETKSQQIILTITNHGTQTVNVRIVNRYTSKRELITLRPGEDEGQGWTLARTSGWYDLTLTVEGDTHFEYRVAGHLEDGDDSSSDPLMGGLV